ncbi:hypothetical protein TcG_04523 [Trypanosoma cruzi]|nr:hypothetical protein TcBrA4_0133300 [Trypanosoma cruzi]RNF19681.1 hypothetical protein TcG_04523 [Trypanosoma cruzi]
MLRRTACTRGGAAAGDPHRYSERAQRIRRQEFFFRQLRRLIIPGFLAYGLFIARPQEGHFLRYLAERRHHDAAFNRLFPPLPAGQSDERTTREGSTPRRGDSGWGWVGSLRRQARGGGGGEESDDEARLARRRLLFARERAYSSSDGGEVFRSVDAAQRAAELASRQEHPPMHLLSQQLQELMRASKSYEAKGSAEAATVVLPVRFEFKDRVFFSTASVVFTDSTGASERRLRFFGVCGMMWWEV